MPNIQELAEGNAVERERLRALIFSLSDKDLAHPMPAGWTVSAALAHLVFWDQRALLLLRKWRGEEIGPSPMDSDILNDAILPLCLAIPPRVAAELVMTTALAIDQEIEGLDAEFAERIEAKGTTIRLNRAPHRHEHIRDIEQALGL
jgi:hypothetical protein